MVLLVTVGLIITESGCSRRPAAVDSEDAMLAIDALYTAITSRQSKLVEDVHDRLKSLASAQKLSSEALRQLESIIESANSGKWESAAKQVDHFIRRQPLTTKPKHRHS
ncbi:MAG: hypothetical protein FJ267_03045 [Planctomycetes bacterium]|nr:hypothetical protein [Planctomycetota bacterium]